MITKRQLDRPSPLSAQAPIVILETPPENGQGPGDGSLGKDYIRRYLGRL
jgi:hypothetical protein